MDCGDQILPICSMPQRDPFHVFVMGNTQEIPQREGGEQGDPLMPMLLS